MVAYSPDITVVEDTVHWGFWRHLQVRMVQSNRTCLCFTSVWTSVSDEEFQHFHLQIWLESRSSAEPHRSLDVELHFRFKLDAAAQSAVQSQWGELHKNPSITGSLKFTLQSLSGNMKFISCFLWLEFRFSVVGLLDVSLWRYHDDQRQKRKKRNLRNFLKDRNSLMLIYVHSCTLVFCFS